MLNNAVSNVNAVRYCCCFIVLDLRCIISNLIFPIYFIVGKKKKNTISINLLLKQCSHSILRKLLYVINKQFN